MSESAFADIGAAVVDDHFPEVDMALRRGRHIDRDDAAWYGFLLDARAVLEPFYRRFGCELIHKSDGYFYLLPTSDKFGRRQLSSGEMLVGQALALLYLDPGTVQSGGVVSRQDVLGHMASVMGTDGLMGAFNPKKKRLDERVAQETVRTRVAEGLRKLAMGGFIEALEGDAYRLRAALMRFAEPVRSSDSPAEALRKLVEKGEAVLTDPSESADASDAEDAEGSDESLPGQGEDEEGYPDGSNEDESEYDDESGEDEPDEEEPEYDDESGEESDDGDVDETAEDESDEAASDGAEDGSSDEEEAADEAPPPAVGGPRARSRAKPPRSVEHFEKKLEALNAEMDDLFDDSFGPDPDAPDEEPAASDEEPDDFDGTDDEDPSPDERGP